MTGLVLFLTLGLLIALGASTAAMMRRLTRPPRKTYAWAVSRGKPGTPAELPSPREFRTVVFNLRGHPCSAWEIPGDDPSAPVVIYTPGWGDSRLGVLPRLGPLIPASSLVIAWDPPGQGESPGVCDLGVHEPDLLRELVEQVRGDGKTDVVLVGASLGAGVSIVAAAPQQGRTPVLGVIAEAPYRYAWTPAFNVMRLAALPFRLNGPLVFALLGLRFADPFWKRFDRAAHAARLACPLLVLHPELDEVSPPSDGRAIAAASARGAYSEVPGGSHNELWIDERTRARSSEIVSSFLASLRREAAK